MLDVGNLQYHPSFSGSEKSDMSDNPAVYWFGEVLEKCTNTFLREFVGCFYAVEELKIQ